MMHFNHDALDDLVAKSGRLSLESGIVRFKRSSLRIFFIAKQTAFVWFFEILEMSSIWVCCNSNNSLVGFCQLQLLSILLSVDYRFEQNNSSASLSVSFFHYNSNLTKDLVDAECRRSSRGSTIHFLMPPKTVASLFERGRAENELFPTFFCS